MITAPAESVVSKYLASRAVKNQIPLSGTFEVTPVCNMNCRMCYIRMSKSQQEAIHPLLSAEDWTSLGKTATDHGMLYLLLTGGEPFLRPDFRQILQELHQMGLVISINSNATLITEEVVQWLKKSPPARINISIYGSSNETYQRLCGNANGFDQVDRAISLLQDAGINIKINFTATPYNVMDMEEVFHYCEDHNLIWQPTSYMFPPVRRDASLTGRNDRMTPQIAAETAAAMNLLNHGKERFLQMTKNSQFVTIPSETEENCQEEGEGIRCRAGKCAFWISWDGKMRPCGMMPGRFPDVLQEGFESAWGKTRQYAQAIHMPVRCTKCSNKNECLPCAAMAVSETGRFDQVPEYRCQMAQAYPDACRALAVLLEEKEGKQQS